MTLDHWLVVVAGVAGFGLFGLFVYWLLRSGMGSPSLSDSYPVTQSTSTIPVEPRQLTQQARQPGNAGSATPNSPSGEKESSD